MQATASQTQKSTTVGRQDSAIFVLVSVVQLMVIVDASIVNVALPSIKNALHFSQVDLQWVINAYTLILAGFLLLGGRAADLLGRRSVLMAGVTFFSGASLVCGLAQSSLMVEVARGGPGPGGSDHLTGDPLLPTHHLSRRDHTQSGPVSELPFTVIDEIRARG